MLSVFIHERQDDWGEHLTNVESAYNYPVSSATSLAPNEVYEKRIPRPPPL